MKKFLTTLLVCGLLLSSAFAIYKKVNPNEQIMKGLIVTDNGTSTGTLIFWANTGGDVVAKGLKDGSGNYYTTGTSLWTFLPGVTITPSLSSEYRFQVGSGALAIGQSSFAMGLRATSTGAYAGAFGYESEARGTGSFAIGYDTLANGFGSIALGHQTIAAGNSSLAAGNGSNAVGVASIAMGESASTVGQASIALGKNVIATRDASLAIGTYNLGLATSIFEIGIGTAIPNKVNAMTVTETGMVYFPQLTGYACLATDANGRLYDNSSSFVKWTSVDTGFNNTGSNTIVPSEKAVYDYVDLYRTWTKSGADIYYTGGDIYGRSLVAKGAGAGAIGINTVAIGNNAYASGSYSVAIGDNAGAFGYGSIAIGNANRSYEQYSTTLGYSNISNTIGGVSLGRFSLGITGALLEVGNGASLLARANAMTLLSSGVAGLWMSTPQHALDVEGAIQTNNAFYLTGGAIPRRITLSGNNLSFQAFTGGVWAEKGSFTP